MQIILEVHPIEEQNSKPSRLNTVKSLAACDKALVTFKIIIVVVVMKKKKDKRGSRCHFKNQSWTLYAISDNLTCFHALPPGFF